MFASRRSLLRTLEREREAFAAERARLIDQICHLSGRTWTPPPSPEPRPEPEPRQTVNPDQFPDGEFAE